MVSLTFKRFFALHFLDQKYISTKDKEFDASRSSTMNIAPNTDFKFLNESYLPHVYFILFTLIFTLFYSPHSQSQLLINDLETGNESAEDLVNILVGGENVVVSNITTRGNPRCFGSFSGGAGSVGFDEGVILSSGSAIDAAGPNVSDETTTEFLEAGDLFLNALLFGEPTFDACVLEFDFQCDGTNSVSVEYVMGSEEYNEFVEAGSNDVFGFALNGTNIATIPESGGLAVSIENINCGNPFDPNSTEPFCDLFINNDLQDGGGNLDIEADGLTTVLRAEQSVSNTPNSMKFAVGDALDEAFDTWVFLKRGSFQCNGPANPTETFNTLLSANCTVWNDNAVYYNEDILTFNEDTQSIELLFDGSDVGLSQSNVDAFTQLPTGEFVLSLSQNFYVPGLGYVRDEDLIKFTPAQLGGSTSGSFEMYFDGSAHGLADCGGDIDALDIDTGIITGTDTDNDGLANDVDSCPLDALNDADGDGICGNVKIYFSPTSTVQINGTWYADEDIIQFDESTGLFSKFFDGSDVGMSHTDVDAFSINTDGSILLSVSCSTTIYGLGSVRDEDILKFTPTSIGVATTGNLEINIVGNETGLRGNYFDFDGVDKVPQ